MRSKAMSLGVLLLFSSSLFAQPIHDSVSVEVVDVPVFVARGGTAVQGLQAGDFELLVNGKPQAVEYFDVVSSRTATARTSLRERRLFLLVFDLAFSRLTVLSRAQKAAAHLVANSGPNDLFAVATFSSRNGIWFATPCTSDRAALARAITNLNATQSGDPLSIVMTPAERAALTGGDTRIDPDVFPRTSTALREIWLAQTTRSAEDQLLDLTELGERLRSLQGQKHVVLLSEGFDRGTRGARNPVMVAAIDRDADGLARLAAQVKDDLAMTVFSSRLLTLSQEMEKAFQKSGVFLHTLDLTGVSTLFEGDALSLLASSTGGKYLHGRNDFGWELTNLADNVGTSYVLGFTPRNARAGHNTIVVRLRHPQRGTTIQYRKGFAGEPTRVDPSEGLYLADVLQNDVPQTGTAATLELNGGTLRAHVPLEPLAAELGGTGKAEMLIYSFDAKGTAVGFHRQAIDVPANARGEMIFEIRLPAGATTAKALLRVGSSLGFSRT